MTSPQKSTLEKGVLINKNKAIAPRLLPPNPVGRFRLRGISRMAGLGGFSWRSGRELLGLVRQVEAGKLRLLVDSQKSGGSKLG